MIKIIKNDFKIKVHKDKFNIWTKISYEVSHNHPNQRPYIYYYYIRSWSCKNANYSPYFTECNCNKIINFKDKKVFINLIKKKLR